MLMNWAVNFAFTTQLGRTASFYFWLLEPSYTWLIPAPSLGNITPLYNMQPPIANSKVTSSNNIIGTSLQANPSAEPILRNHGRLNSCIICFRHTLSATDTTSRYLNLAANVEAVMTPSNSFSSANIHPTMKSGANL